MTKSNARLLRECGYGLDQVLEIIDFKFNFELESGRNIHYLSASKLYEAFDEDYKVASTLVKVVDTIEKSKGNNRSNDWIAADLTANMNYYRSLLMKEIFDV